MKCTPHVLMFWRRPTRAASLCALLLAMAFGRVHELRAQPLALIGRAVSLEHVTTGAGDQPVLAHRSGQSDRAWWSAGEAAARRADDAMLLVWMPPSQQSKIVVSTASPAHAFTLYVEALHVHNGTSQGAVVLTDGMTETDLVRDIQPGHSGQGKIHHRSQVDGSPGAGTDTDTVTFTITAQ